MTCSRRVGATAIVALLLAAQSAAAQLVIEFPEAGSREVWFANVADRHVPPSGKVSATGDSIELEIDDEKRGQIVCVHDTESGRVATREVGDLIESGVWSIDLAEFDSAYQIRVRILDSGGNVESGAVRLVSTVGEANRLVNVRGGGDVEFFNVPFGSLRVTVLYSFADTDHSTPAQTFTLDEDPASTREFTIDLNTEPSGEPEPVATAEQPETEEQAPVEGTTLAGLITGLIVIAGIGLVAYWFFFKFPQREEMLKKAGLLTPDDTVDPHSPSDSGDTRSAAKPEKIVLSGAEPQRIDPAGAAVAPSAASAASVPNPRLTAGDGSVHMIPDEEAVVGRDESCSIALVSESSVSRKHARLIRTEDGKTVVEDLGSTNGTYVGGQRLNEPIALNPGDTVQFGQVSFRYEE